VDPLSRFVYVAEGSNNVTAFHIGPTGALTPVPGSPFLTGVPSSVAVDPFSGSVYVPNSSSRTVSAFHINPTTGALTPVKGSPFPAKGEPSAAAVDLLGRFVYVAESSNADFSGTVSAYSIGRNGALAPVPGSPSPAGVGSVSVAVAP
jgi:6-phosphogluconolactonase